MKLLLIRAIRVGTIVLLLSSSACAWLPHWHRHRHRAADVASVPAELMPAATTPAQPAAGSDERTESDEPPTTTVDAPVPESTAGAVELANDFYLMHQRLHTHAVPDAGSMNAYNAFLCPQLGALIDEARTRRQQYVAAHPGGATPWIDGDVFSSLADGPQVAKADMAVAIAGGARVAVAMSRGNGREATRWTDSVVLDRDADGIWCLADVEYQGTWPEAIKGRLSDVLKAGL